MALERIHHVHGGDSAAAPVLRVNDSVFDDILEEGPQHEASLFVHEAADALDAATPVR